MTSRETRPSFRKIVWLFPVVVALHEAEELTILGWYRRHFGAKDLDRPTLVVGLLLVTIFFTLVTVVAQRIRSESTSAAIAVIASAAFAANALQHVYWTASFAEYAPGVATAVTLVLPYAGYLAARALREGRVPPAVVALGAALMGWVLVETVLAENRRVAAAAGLHRLARAIAELLGASGGA